jgi:hypothetical protein
VVEGVGGGEGEQVSRAISVSECSLPSWNVSRIATILLVTERPGSAELPAIGDSLFLSSSTEIADTCP